MKRAHVLLIVVGVAVVASATCLWLGFRQGREFTGAFTHAMTAPASLVYLQAIQDGKIDDYTILMESDIDRTLLVNHHLEENSVFRLLGPFWGADLEAGRRDSLTRLANYRKGHPSPLRPEALEALMAQVPKSERQNLPEITPSLRQSMLETQKIIDGMVNRYAGKTSNGK